MSSTPIFPFAVWAAGTNQNSVPANDNALRNQILNGSVLSQTTTAQPGAPATGDIYIIASTHTGAQWSTFSPKDLAIYDGATWHAYAPIEGVIANVAGFFYQYTGGAWVAVTVTAGPPDQLVNAQTGTTYTYVTGDKSKLVTHTNGSSIAGTLPQAGGAFGAGWWMDVNNRGVGTLTITPTTSTIDGVASLALATGQGVRIVSDGTNYFTQRGIGAAQITTQGKHAIPIMAAGIRPSVAGGCAVLAAIASAANQPDIVTLDFDATTEEYAQFAIPMPKKWNEGTITAQFRWSHAATTTNFGVVWGLQAVAVSDNDAIAVAFGTAQTVTDTGGTTNNLYITAETSAITVAGSPANEDTVFFRVYRKAADASDTMAIDARLHSVVIFITTNADTDA